MKEKLPVNEDVIFNKQLLSIERSQENNKRTRVGLSAIVFWMVFAVIPLLFWTYSLVYRSLVE